MEDASSPGDLKVAGSRTSLDIFDYFLFFDRRQLSWPTGSVHSLGVSSFLKTFDPVLDCSFLNFGAVSSLQLLQVTNLAST